jgi:plastocyanin
MPQVPNNVKFGVPLLVVSFAVFAILLWGGDQLIRSDHGGGGGATTAETPGPSGGPVTLTIVAKNITFNTRSLSAGAGSQVTVTLDNQDPGILHNIAFYKAKGSTAQPLVTGSKGNLLTGVAKESFTFAAPGPGTYYFQCDVHPDVMNGSFVVR